MQPVIQNPPAGESYAEATRADRGGRESTVGFEVSHDLVAEKINSQPLLVLTYDPAAKLMDNKALALPTPPHGIAI